MFIDHVFVELAESNLRPRVLLLLGKPHHPPKDVLPKFNHEFTDSDFFLVEVEE